MGVLFFADDVTGPSLLWMRRMLRGLGQDVTLLVTEKDPGPEYREQFEVLVLTSDAWSLWWRLLVRLGRAPRVPRIAKPMRQLLSAVRSEAISVLLVHYLTIATKYDRLWRRTPQPVFVHCHGYDVTWDLRLADSPDRKAHGSDYMARVRALPDHVQFIANSRHTVQRLRGVGIGEDRIHLKYLGVPVEPLRPRDSLQREVNILYLGRLVDCKGPDIVIRAFDLACRRGLQGRLVIAGDGAERGACERALAASAFGDRIELLGFVDAETGDRLRREADIFTAHSRRGPVSGQEEAFGVSFVEAMAAGLPIVSGRHGSMTEIVEHGEQGILVEPGDVEAHAEAFLLLADEPGLRARLGQSGWQRARELFSLERENTRLREILGLRAADISSLHPLESP